MKKIAILIVAMATLSMFFVSVSIANVPAPPVNQVIGFDDVSFDAQSAADCRGCHDAGLPDQHHMLYGFPMTEGKCRATVGLCEDDGTTVCGADRDCPTGICLIAEQPCYLDSECEMDIQLCDADAGICESDSDCSRRHYCMNIPGEETPNYCAGGGASQDNPNDGVYGCMTCHWEELTGGVINFVVERDCTVCHVADGGANVHHKDAINLEDAMDTNCTSCHGDLVDDSYDNHTIREYAPSLVTPMPHRSDDRCTDNLLQSCTADDNCTAGTCEEIQLTGGCKYCHDGGTDTASGLEVENMYNTHHHTGIYQDRLGDYLYLDQDMNGDNETDPDGERLCGLCHLNGDYHPSPGTPNKLAGIRQCEICHGMESLHSIQADTGTVGIVVGGELAGFGHVGADDPGNSSDCWGCHGFGASAAGATGSATITPSIDTLGPIVITAGTDASVTIAGNAFTNDAKTSVIELTPVFGGDVIAITPDSISVGSITATVNVPAGAYKLRAVKEDAESNPVVLIAAGADVEAIITQISCGSNCIDGNLTIDGSGFGAELPAGVQSYMNVMQDGTKLTIVSWTDTQIVVSGYDCDGGPITVNGLFGSATK